MDVAVMVLVLVVLVVLCVLVVGVVVVVVTVLVVLRSAVPTAIHFKGSCTSLQRGTTN